MDWRPPDSPYNKTLNDLVSNSADIEGAALVTTDGNLIASVFPNSINSKSVILITSALASAFALSECLVWDARRANINQLYLKLEHGFLVVLAASDNSLLIVLCKEQAKLGLIFGGGGRLPLDSLPEPIIPPRSPGSLRAHAEPEYDDDDV